MGRLTLWFSVALAATLAGCARPAGPDVVASIAGEPIRYQEFSDYVTASVGARAEGLNSRVLAALFDQFLDQAVANRIAAAEVSPGTPSDRTFEVWVDSLPVEPPTTAELQARYRRNRSRYSLPQRVVLRQIVVDSLEEARAVRHEIVDGGDFASIADRLQPEGEYGPAGGLQGTFAAGDLPREVAEHVFALEPSVVGEIVEMEHGYALFMVDRFIEPEEKSFAQMRDTLSRQLAAERRQQALENRVEAFRRPENVTIYPANLPFEYGGAYEDLADDSDQPT